MVPIFYRTHAHSIVNVMSIYLVKEGKWTELGKTYQIIQHEGRLFFLIKYYLI